MTSFSSAGQQGQRRADRDRRLQPPRCVPRVLPLTIPDLQLPLRLPRVRPPHRSRPRFLPQGRDGNDELSAIGNRNYLYVCPASALPTPLDLVFFRRATAATIRARPAAPAISSMSASPEPADGRRRGRATSPSPSPPFLPRPPAVPLPFLRPSLSSLPPPARRTAPKKSKKNTLLL